MKSLFHILWMILVPVFIISCDKEDNHNFPKSIHFPAKGGYKIVSGNDPFAFLLIGDGTDEYHSDEINDTITVSHDWLSVKTEKGSNSLIIYTEPSTLIKKRSLKIYGYFGREYAVIDVIQDGISL